MILVVGATGLLGGMITHNLLAAGQQVRILVREDSPSTELAKQGLATDAQTLIRAGAVPITGNLKDRASLDRACQGVQTVLTTASATLRDLDLEGVDLNGTQNLMKAAKAAGVDQFIYTSANGSDPNSPDPVFKIKASCEQYLKNSGLNYTILKPGIFMEIWIGTVVGMPLQAGQPVTLAGRGDHRHSFVSMQDVAKFGVAVIDHPAARNQSIAVGGPASHSWTEVVQGVGNALGQELPIQYVSFDQSIPLLPAGMPDMLKNLETFETFIDMSQTAPQYGVNLTSLDTFAQTFFAQPQA
jgi:NADH dehydrogenase